MSQRIFLKNSVACPQAVNCWHHLSFCRLVQWLVFVAVVLGWLYSGYHLLWKFPPDPALSARVNSRGFLLNAGANDISASRAASHLADDFPQQVPFRSAFATAAASTEPPENISAIPYISTGTYWHAQPSSTGDPEWCPDQTAAPANTTRPHLLASCVYTRIYANDLSAISKLDVLHWMTYYRYAGVQHIYIYDCWCKPGEQLRDWLQPAIDAGFVTYNDWHNASMLMEADPKADHISVVEVPARAHCQKHYGDLFTWVLHTDVDEFPFASHDTRPGFLTRFLRSEYVRSQPQTVEHTMDNYIMLGWRNYTRGPCVLQQVQRRTVEIGNLLVKPIVLSRAIAVPSVHHNQLKSGNTVLIPSHILAMRHYWGGRMQSWQPVMPADLLKKTAAEPRMLGFVDAILACRRWNHTVVMQVPVATSQSGTHRTK